MAVFRIFVMLLLSNIAFNVFTQDDLEVMRGIETDKYRVDVDVTVTSSESYGY